MPIVIPKTGPVTYVRSEEILGEILGHDNFDGESWAIGDRLIFENGTESSIEQVPDDSFYTWPDPVPANFEEVKHAVGFEDAQSWEQLFERFQAQSKRGGCAAAIILSAVAVASCV